ncbi:hypothetical protein GX408_02255 [bacterium]|nr:hypothetical protein [bacterium]
MKTITVVPLPFLLWLPIPAGFSQPGVKIGNQEWMPTNLDISMFQNGESIPEAETEKEWEEAAKQGKPAWCYYQNDPASGQVYVNSNWYAVNDKRAIAPPGWHVPGAAEWQTLVRNSSSMEVAGNKLKETGTKHKHNPSTGAESLREVRHE